ALTPLMIASFQKHFGRQVALLHSRLSQGERYEEWCRLITGEATIAVGARSAVFAPIKNLGIIIIDEEHERTYKQEETPRYRTHEVAAERCRIHNAHLLLGSATPSLETYREALLGDCRLLALSSRIGGKAMPAVEIIDMRRELKDGNKSMFSRSLYRSLQETMAEGKKAIIFLNRRGHSTCVLCRECGHVMRCPFCDISLTYHSSGKKMICHYCYYAADVPDLCPVCKSVYIRYFGTGTQKVEAELLKYFPGTRVLRMDLDTTTRKNAHKKILMSFEKEGPAILVGTQMIAKGLDIPGVTLVGVIAADIGLNLPDFRAAERTFQLLTQVSGRAGRGKEQGKVIIQTYAPEHYSIMMAKNHDFKGFYAQEIQFRKELDYPPFCSLLRLVLTSRNEEMLELAALKLKENKKIFESSGLETLGPVPCPLGKKNKSYRWHMLFKGTDKELLRERGKICRDYIRDNFKNVTVSLDFEPYSML
ncbi:MAG TPA: primosomal protein N', partial [Firmicutes bacterium]|nr:primosomal protein N' [Bacillota bacterium]